MNSNDDLNDKNFLLFAMKMYDNPAAISDEEFFEDLRRIKYLKKLVTRYRATGELKERLILNHLTILGNVFESSALCRMIWLKMSDYLIELKPFLIALGMLPERVMRVRGQNHDPDDVSMDPVVVDALRKLLNEQSS